MFGAWGLGSSQGLASRFGDVSGFSTTRAPFLWMATEGIAKL